MKYESKRYCAQVTSSAAERGDVKCFVHALNSGDKYDPSGMELTLNALMRNIGHIRFTVRSLGHDARLPRAQRHGGNTEALECHRAQRHRRLLSGRKQRIQFSL